MKKIILLLAVVGMFSLQGCVGPEGPPGQDGQDGLIAEVFQLDDASFSYNANDGFNIYKKLNPLLYDEDIILIYRKVGFINQTNAPIWQQIPKTIYTSKGRLDYDFDFSNEHFIIYVKGNYDLTLTPQYLNNQTFRIVIVPGSKSGSAKFVNKNNYLDYNAVIKKYNIDDSNIKVLN